MEYKKLIEQEKDILFSSYALWTHKIFFSSLFRLSRSSKRRRQTSKLDTEVLFSIEFSVSHYYSFLLGHDTKMKWQTHPCFSLSFNLCPLNRCESDRGKKNLKPIIKINFFFFRFLNLYNFLCVLLLDDISLRPFGNIEAKIFRFSFQREKLTFFLSTRVFSLAIYVN